jgi:YHS domain-containing protein
MTTRDVSTDRPTADAASNGLPYGHARGGQVDAVQSSARHAAPSASGYTAQSGGNAPAYGGVSQASANPPAASSKPALCLDGRCPVTFHDTKNWAHGDRRFGAVHRGRLYLFVNAAAQQRFLADPDKYSPAVSGHDAVAWVEQGQFVPGVMKFGGEFNGLVYLFSSEATLRQFEANPKRYAAPVEQAISSGRNQGQIRR